MDMNELRTSVRCCADMLSCNVNDSFGNSIIEDVCKPIYEILTSLSSTEESFTKESVALYNHINAIQAVR